ncbi:MAG: hypothetical protein KAX38_01370 [Candidatus Krumholzibacteria bacterium]|nr:hypothetical protein [Candidatus Krumholzibacteria bacterium]
MQKIISGLLLLVSIFLLPSNSMAQFSFELGGGIAGPTGDSADYWKWDKSFGLSGGAYRELTPFTSLGLNCGYTRLAFDGEAYSRFLVKPTVTIDGGNYSIMTVCAEVRFHVGAMDMAHFFGGVGGGLYKMGLSDITYSDATGTQKFDSENKFGAYIHAGTAFSVTPLVKLGLKGRYNFFSGFQPTYDNGVVATDFKELSSFWELSAFVLIGVL